MERRQDIPPIPAGLIERVQKARHIVVLTGAGISAESGVPTFREAQTGLWAQYDPQQLATPAAFAANPALVWEWYDWRRQLIAGAAPNAGHRALVRMESRAPAFALITQNVDGLHARAGSSAPIELHGNIQRTKCAREGQVVESWQPAAHSPPRCPRCGGLLRPDVVWFGEGLSPATLQKAISAASHCDLFFSVGTSAMVQPAASLPLLARARGAVTVEINPVQTPISEDMDFLLAGPAGVILPALVQRAWPTAE